MFSEKPVCSTVALSESEILGIIQEMKEEYAKPLHSAPKILEKFRQIASDFRVRFVENFL